MKKGRKKRKEGRRERERQGRKNKWTKFNPTETNVCT